jgi:hypothetical protein
MVYSNNNFRVGWDGRYKGRDCEIGSYYWVISAVDLNNKEQLFKGDITLLR